MVTFDKRRGQEKREVKEGECCQDTVYITTCLQMRLVWGKVNNSTTSDDVVVPWAVNKAKAMMIGTEEWYEVGTGPIPL